MVYSFYVVLGMGLLLLPLWFWHGPDARLAAFDQREWPKGLNLLLALLDLGRAAGGAYLLQLGLPELPILANHSEWRVELVLAGIITLGLVVQTLAWHDEDHVQAPVAFLAGVTLILVDLRVVGLAGALALGASFAVRAWSMLFFAASAGTVLIGWLLSFQSWPRVIFLGVALAVPPVVSVMAGRHMGWPRK